MSVKVCVWVLLPAVAASSTENEPVAALGSAVSTMVLAPAWPEGA